MIKVLVADDHQSIRDRVIQLLQDDFEDVEIEEADDSPALIEKALLGGWDLIISDLVMPGGNGIDAVRKICDSVPAQRILILSINDEEKYAGPAKLAGASGYLSKSNVSDDLGIAVRTILSGQEYFP